MNRLQTFTNNLKQKARKLNQEVYALYLAYKHPKVAWYAKVIIALTIGYALSPIDLIPDFIPVFGYLDDLVIVPVGVALSIKLIPKAVLKECRQQAADVFINHKPAFKNAVLVVVFSWVLMLAIVTTLVYKFWKPDSKYAFPVEHRR
jgi:uncharacterized membrane protein YkvA (DUF1232 family)